MSPRTFSESIVEDAALLWFEELGYDRAYGPDIAPGEPNAERTKYQEAFLPDRLRRALRKLNSNAAEASIEEAFRKITHPQYPGLIASNREAAKLLIDGVSVEAKKADGRGSEIVRLVDFDHPEANDWLVVNQFTIKEGEHTRRPDIVVFVNGLPLAVHELKDPTDENATIWTAHSQIETYKQEVPSLFTTNACVVISDGIDARVGTITSGRDRFATWPTIDGVDLAPKAAVQLEVLIRGMFERRRFLDLMRSFIVFEDGDSIVKKLAGYHQFFAVQKALESTLTAASTNGSRKGGVVWHTQGSGKSLTMGFLVGKYVREPALENPTIVILTDRNDLDQQLFDNFSLWTGLFRQKPVKAESREELKAALNTSAGGIIFTTIQKFFPEEKGEKHPLLTDRRNVIVLADEAHRSQYGFQAKFDEKSGDITYGFAKHVHYALPNATFVGFTGTPVELKDANTRAVFGEYIDIYDIERAQHDKATVPIYYENRLVKLKLKDDEKPKIDANVEEVTEGEELETREQTKTRWAKVEAIVGSEHRLAVIAQDIVDHFEKRQAVLPGKAMVVCMSRRICIELYKQITKLRPEWHTDGDTTGTLKVVMTGSATDPLDWQPHIRNKKRRDALAKRFKRPDDPLRLVLVRDMWLTGFDAPCMHTIYLDKPMKGHGLMQAIARVNRVFGEKPGGLVVDYLGLADQLRAAVATYTESGGKGDPVRPEASALAVLLEKFEIVEAMFHGFNYMKFTTGTPAERLALLPAAQEHLYASCEDEPARIDATKRYVEAVAALSQAYALTSAQPEVEKIAPSIAFFQAVRAAMVKTTQVEASRGEVDRDLAMQQLVSRAIIPEGKPIDIFTAAGLDRPDISILSPEFLRKIQEMPEQNLAVRVLERLLHDEIKTRMRTNVVKARSFTQMLEDALKRYAQRMITTTQVILQLIDVAKGIQESRAQGEALGLTGEEEAFYDALAENQSAKEVMGDDKLSIIAKELVTVMRRNTSVDWTYRESVRARLRVEVKRLLRKYGYPPDLEKAATETVIQQAEVICKDWDGEVPEEKSSSQLPAQTNEDGL